MHENFIMTSTHLTCQCWTVCTIHFSLALLLRIYITFVASRPLNWGDTHLQAEFFFTTSLNIQCRQALFCYPIAAATQAWLVLPILLQYSSSSLTEINGARLQSYHWLLSVSHLRFIRSFFTDKFEASANMKIFQSVIFATMVIGANPSWKILLWGYSWYDCLQTWQVQGSRQLWISQRLL